MDEHAKLRYLKDIEYFSAKLDVNPSSKVFMPLSLAYLRLEKFDEVISVCQTGLDNNPEYIAAKTIMAQAFLGKGLREEAKGLLIEVATLNKDNYRANKLLGEIYRAEDNPEKALYYYRTALISAPEDSILRRMIEELAGVTDLKPATLEEIEYEQSSMSEEGEESDLVDEATDLAEDLEMEGLGENAEAIDLLDAEQKISELLQADDFDGARAYVNENFLDDDEYKQKKLKEIDAEESLNGMDEGANTPPLDGLDMEESAPKEIIIPEEPEGDDLDMENLFGEDFDVSVEDAPEEGGPAELDFLSEDSEVPDEMSAAEDLLGDGFLEDDIGASTEVTEERLADVDLADEPENPFGSLDEPDADPVTEFTDDEPAESTEIEGVAETEENDFADILDEKIISAEQEQTAAVAEAEEEAATAEAQLPDVNAEAVERLEGWMQNISKSKSARNV